MKWAAILLLIATPAWGYSLKEPTTSPDNKPLTATNRLLACVHAIDGQYVDWLRPTAPTGGGTVDLTMYKPRTFLQSVKAACIFCTPTSCPVWGPAHTGTWTPGGTFVPTP